MTWKTELKKEKFQGPQRQFAGVDVIGKLQSTIKNINYHLENIEKNIDAVESEMVKRQIKGIREEVDKADETLIELAKYGGRNIEDQQGKKDEKYIDAYSGKYRTRRDEK